MRGGRLAAADRGVNATRDARTRREDGAGDLGREGIALLENEFQT